MKSPFSLRIALLFVAGLAPTLLAAQSADDLFAAGEYGKAHKAYRRTIDDGDTSVVTLLRAAGAARQSGRKASAGSLLLRSFGAYPLESSIFYVFDPAGRLLDDEKSQEAIYKVATAKMAYDHPDSGDFRRTSIRLPHRHSEAFHFYLQLGNNLLWRGEHEKALLCFERAYAATPDPRVALRAGLCAAEIRYEDVARQHLTAAFDSLPGYALSYVRLHRDLEGGLNNQLYLKLLQERVKFHFPDFDAALTARIDDIWEEFIWYRQILPPQEQATGDVPEGDYNGFAEIYHPGLAPYRDSLVEHSFRQLDSLFNDHGIPDAAQVADRAHLPLKMVSAAPRWFMDKWWDVLYARYQDTEDPRAPRVRELAYAYDAALIRDGQRQRFGTVLIWPVAVRQQAGLTFYPTENPAALGTRRATIGLLPHSEYWSPLGFFFDADAHAGYEGLPEGHFNLPVVLRAYSLAEILEAPHNKMLGADMQPAQIRTTTRRVETSRYEVRRTRF